MECPAMETGSLFSTGIKRHVKDKRNSKTAKLNVSLASKIKTKILNNSSIFKISLKHNNRALAQALSREKENTRRITTEKMLLQKEVEKLNFENTFLRLKLNNLNKKLIEIEALMNNNLITAIEMSSLSEFHQNSFQLPASEKKRISKWCTSMRLPFARVPLTSSDDDDDNDDKENIHCDNIIKSKTSSDSPSLVSTVLPLSTQYNLEMSSLKENNQNVCGLSDSEYTPSTVDVLSKESHYHSDQSSKSSLMNEIRNASSIGHRWDRPSPSNVTERKKRGSSQESNNLSADTPHVIGLDQQQISNSELNWNNEINDCIKEKNITTQRNRQHLLGLCSESVDERNAEYRNPVQDNDDFQLQKTVYDADMDLTASEVSKIVTVSTGTKNKSSNETKEGAMKTFRKVKDSSSEKRKERSKRQFENSCDVDIDKKIENGLERRSVVLDDKRDSEDPDFIFSTEQLTQADILKKITLRNEFHQDDRQNTQCNKKKKRIHAINMPEKAHSSQSSDKFQQESKFDMGQNSLTCNKSKASRQTFMIHKLEKDNLFLNQRDEVTISENLEVTNEFQTANVFIKDNGNLCDYETQNRLDSNEYVTDMQPPEQNESKINKLRKTINRRTEVIFGMNQIYEDNDKDVYGLKEGNVFFQKDKETISGNPEAADKFLIPSLFTRDNGNLYNCETQNTLSLQKQIADVYPVQQNESRVNKLRQKINRKTEIISKINNLDSNKSEYCPVKGNSFFPTPKGKEIIPGKLEDSRGFQAPILSTKVNGNLCDYETQNVLGAKKDVHIMQSACQNEPRVDKKLKQRVLRKTEIISEINQVHENDDRGVHDLGKGNFFSPTPNDKGTISENLQVTREFQTADLPTKDRGNSCYYENQNILELKKHVTDTQSAEQNEPKVKKLRQKVNRKTEIISQVNHLDNKSEYCPIKGNSFFPTPKGKEIIPGNLEDPRGFQATVLSTKVNGNLCDYETQNVLGAKKHVHDMQSACQNEPRIDKKLKQRMLRKTEIISEISQIHESDERGVHDLGKVNFFSPTPNDKGTISENLQVTREFQTADLPIKDNGNLCHYESQNILELKKHVTDRQPAEQNEPKVNKKLRQKVDRKTKVISEINQISEKNDKGTHGQESYTEDLEFKISKPKQRLECHAIISGYSVEINSNEKQSCDQISNSYKPVKKCKKESSGKAKNILTKGKNKPILQLTDSSEIAFFLEPDLKHVVKEVDSDLGNPVELHKTQKQSTIPLNNKRETHFVEMTTEGECQVIKVNKKISKSKKRKTSTDPSPESHEVILTTTRRKSVHSDQADKENNVENEKMVKMKPDLCTKMFKSPSPIHSPPTQDSSFDSVEEGSVPFRISSGRNLIIKESFDLDCSTVFLVSDVMHEETNKMKRNTNQRARKSGTGDRPLQDLTNTTLISNNTAESENKSEDVSSELPSRRRRCAPLHYKEPNLRDKMRR
ncbi:shugoshin 2 isoform X2 [Nycticebus coucang]|nr:shugoshin 2 isoform X2 [Nycticebus coucang]XP_053452268.1 shugoshin 2 isoform X2 [Nycticebus coucang]